MSEPGRTRRICVATGSRAEYGLLRWLMHDVKASADLALQVVVTGAHLVPAFGETWREIEADGFRIDARVDLQLEDDSPSGTARSAGVGVIGFADVLSRLVPDIVVLLGDRYETLAAAFAALILRIPVAHIHGGERSEGVFDEAMRHAITKMAHLHFVAAPEYRRRVLQLGEAPECVFDVGAATLDAIERLDLADRAELEFSLGMPLEAPVFLVTLHPETLADAAPGRLVDSLLAALAAFAEARVVFTGSNADPGGRVIAARCAEWAAAHAGRARFVENLGQRRYLGLMELADVVIGNSSSGVIEAPYLQTPTVNIGRRQQGRLRAASIIDCGTGSGNIRDAIMRALSDEQRESTRAVVPPYGSPGAAQRIVHVLKSVDTTGLLVKSFHDLPM